MLDSNLSRLQLAAVLTLALLAAAGTQPGGFFEFLGAFALLGGVFVYVASNWWVGESDSPVDPDETEP